MVSAKNSWDEAVEFFSVLEAIKEAAKRRPRRLAAILRSDRTLSRHDRQWLADLIEGRLRGKAGRPRVYGPRPRNKPEKETEALQFAAVHYNRILQEKRDRGLRYKVVEDTLDEAIAIAENVRGFTPDRTKVKYRADRLRRNARTNSKN